MARSNFASIYSNQISNKGGKFSTYYKIVLTETSVCAPDRDGITPRSSHPRPWLGYYFERGL